jgi:DNA processing protein
LKNEQVILHASLISGIGPGTISTVLQRKPAGFSNDDLYHLSPADVMHLFGIPEGTARVLVDGLADRDLVAQELALAERHGISWITIEHEQYPPLLRAIHLPPPILYVRGAPLTNAVKPLAFVGARIANEYGKAFIDATIPPLVARNWTIVSGGARGADSFAHKATLACGGVTIAVLGSGLLRPYPATNIRLFDAIVEAGGSVVTSFPLECEGFPGNFPARNRIISGLSRGVVVVQAAVKSGARITAEYASEQGREVFAVPGPINDELSLGCHALIKEGAQLINGAQDILQEFGETVVGQPYKPAIRDQMAIPLGNPVESNDPHLSAKTMIVQQCVMPRSVDELMAAANLSLGEITPLLFDLQLSDLLEQNFMGKWHRKI